MPKFDPSPEKFQFYRLRFSFRASQPILFPPGKSGNVVRGAFGTIFRQIACVPTCDATESCEIRDACPYAQIFEPRPTASHPSGLAELPRPFVFRAAHLDGPIAPGQPFHFDIHLFNTRAPVLPYFVLTFAQLAREGIGPGRGRASLDRVEQLDLAGNSIATLFDGKTFHTSGQIVPTSIHLSPTPPVTAIRLRFVTPTELKSGQQLVTRPEFHVLFARLRDRISTLGDLYGAGPLGIDFRAAAARAAAIRLTHCGLRYEALERRSSKTGRSHPMGGFAGEVVYEGDLAEFVPYIEAGKWTGVGRQTVWGKGELDVEY